MIWIKKKIKKIGKREKDKDQKEFLKVRHMQKEYFRIRLKRVRYKNTGLSEVDKIVDERYK